MLLAFKIALIILVALPFIVYAGYKFSQVSRFASELNRQEKEQKLKEREAAIAAAAAFESEPDPMKPGFAERLQPEQATGYMPSGYTGFIDQNQTVGYQTNYFSSAPSFLTDEEPEPEPEPVKYEDQYVEPPKPAKRKKTTRRRRK